MSITYLSRDFPAKKKIPFFMEKAQIVLEYIQVLIWPIVIVSVVIIFLDNLKRLIDRLKSAGLPGGVSLDFSQELREAERFKKLVETAATSEQDLHVSKKDSPSIPLTQINVRLINLGSRPSPSGLDPEYYVTYANRDPVLALAGIRLELEIAVKNIAQGFKQHSSHTPQLNKYLKHYLKTMQLHLYNMNLRVVYL